MQKHHLQIATNKAGQLVEGVTLVPGIAIVDDVGNPLRRALIHEKSGMAIAVNLKPAGLMIAQYLLANLDWTVSVTSIRSNPAYYGVITVLQDRLKRSRIQEERVAADFKGKRQPASGSRPGKKRDVVTGGNVLQSEQTSAALMFELKTYERTSCTVSLRDIDFLRRQAYTRGLIPAYAIELDGKEEVVITTSEDFESISLASAIPLELNEKSVPLSNAVVANVLDGVTMHFTYNGFSYVVISYSTLLQLARGSECRQTDAS